MSPHPLTNFEAESKNKVWCIRTKIISTSNNLLIQYLISTNHQEQVRYHSM